MPAANTRNGRSTPKKKANEPFDLDAAVREARNENDLTAFTFTFGGEVYEFPPDFDLKALEALDEGRFDVAFYRLLGPEQVMRLEAQSQTFGLVALAKVMDAYMAHLGLDVGKLSASTDS